MAGHVRKHGNGWQAVAVDGFGRGAQRRLGSIHRLKADARDELSSMQSELLSGMYIDRQASRVSLVDRMRADIERRSDRSYNTTVAASNALMHAEEFFGTRAIGSISHSDVQAFVSSLDLAPSSVGTVFSHVRATIRTAIADGVVGRDPTIKVKLPRPVKSAMVIASNAEVERLHACSEEGFGVAIVLGAGCGLRSQETAGLVVDDIDFLRRELHVRRQWHGRLDEFADLKGKASRAVPIGDDICNALAAHLAEHGAGEHGLVLHTDAGVPLDQALFQARWRKVKKTTGIELRFHSLRHHFASAAISAGVPLPALSKALGHSKISVTLDEYAHLLPGDEDRLRSASTLRFGRKETA